MSFLRRGERRRGRVATAATTVALLGAFQVLAIIGAGAASASGTCAYDLATQRVNVSVDSGTGSTLSVSDGSVAGTAAGDILFDGAACGGSPNITNTASVNVTTAVSNTAESFAIDNTFGAPDREFPSTIAWFVDLGQGAGDTLVVFGADQTDNVYVFANTSFDLDGAAGTTAGLEVIVAFGDDGDDTLDGSALGTGVQFIAFGGLGVDWIAPGAHLADVVNGGGDAGDTLSYGTRTNSTIIGNPAATAGFDANGNGVLAAPEEMDIYVGFDTFETGSGNDLLFGTGADEWFIPGDGDDEVDGGGAVTADTVDWSSSSAAMVIDVPNGSATGQGTDTYSNGVAAFVGSDFDDTLLTDGSAPGANVLGFCGGDGVDTVDGSAETGATTINLETLDNWCTTATDDLENAIGGSGSDTLIGNDNRNRLEGNDGDDVLSGAAGNDTLMGGAGNDTFTGGGGADRVSFANSPNGVTADLSLGFATGEGDDGFGDLVEIVVGSGFGDTLTGGPFAGGGTVNFLFNGRGGDDVLTGYNGNDTLRGGGGNDVLRGVAGDDNLRGARGNDRLFGGQGVDVGKGGPGSDVCRGVEISGSCGTAQKPKANAGRQL